QHCAAARHPRRGLARYVQPCWRLCQRSLFRHLHLPAQGWMTRVAPWGHKRTWSESALPPKADIVERDRHVCFVPKADQVHCSEKAYGAVVAISLSPRNRTFGSRTAALLAPPWTGIDRWPRALP